jgi:c-di-GMP-binding flagellar brake protein YcgR
MPITDKHDAEIIRRVTEEAERFQAKVNQIDLAKQILDIDCPDENKAECAIALQKILDECKTK